ncbi:MAG: hypothetical protein ACE14M_07280 [Terriglobales bacterium]
MASQRIGPLSRTALRPAVTSYDSGYEHSLEHMLEVQRMVAEADEPAAAPVSTKPAVPAGVTAQAVGF